ncbi:MAG: sugar phosphate isomerase/epimerase family protein [Pirellulaceae bacterium]
MSEHRINRREALQLGACLALASGPAVHLLAQNAPRKFKIGACDWSIGRMQDVSALELAKTIGLDGVQVTFGQVGAKYDLRKPQAQAAYREACQKLDVEIASLGMVELNNKPYASDPEAEAWLLECVDVMSKMGQKVVLIPFFSAGDIRDKPEAQQEVIRRLKKAAPLAEKAGVILGIESWLNADDHLRILDAVGSPAVQVYYDVANMEQCGYDVYQGIRQLGRDRICEIHAKENGFLLGQGKVDFNKVKDALDDIQWSGWLIIEGATVEGKSLEDCYKLNLQYLRTLFPA